MAVVGVEPGQGVQVMSRDAQAPHISALDAE